MKTKIALLLVLVTAGLCLANARRCNNNPPVPDGLNAPPVFIRGDMQELIVLESTARLDKGLVPECSGLVRSKKYPGIFWTLSDSGAAPNIVAIRADGSIVKPPGASVGYQGIRVKGASNVDWEAICIDHQGRLIIADTGNNANARHNLALFVFPEPDPQKDTETEAVLRIPVKFARQKQFPDPRKRYDCEAIFTHGNELYALTKRRKDTWTELHRLKYTNGGEGEFIPVAAFNSRGMVTDAATSPDGRRLVVLTYHNVWLFELPAAGADAVLSGPAWYARLQFPLNAWQVEAITFLDDSRILIGSEQGMLYTLELSRLAKIQ